MGLGLVRVRFKVRVKVSIGGRFKVRVRVSIGGRFRVSFWLGPGRYP